MYWTTLAAVFATVQVRPKDKPHMTMYMNDAGLMVTNICLKYGNCPYSNTINQPTTLATLEQIQRYLTAHLYQSVIKRFQEELTAGKSKQKTSNSVNLFLSNTHYGQMAMAMDINGGLAWWNMAVSKGGRIITRIDHLGRKHMPQILLGDIGTYAYD